MIFRVMVFKIRPYILFCISSGVLSHAEWREDLKLAEITQQTGGYWQFLGHYKDNKLYLRPEEALFLMEVVR